MLATLHDNALKSCETQTNLIELAKAPSQLYNIFPLFNFLEIPTVYVAISSPTKTHAALDTVPPQIPRHGNKGENKHVAEKVL